MKFAMGAVLAAAATRLLTRQPRDATPDRMQDASTDGRSEGPVESLNDSAGTAASAAEPRAANEPLPQGF
jgi:hypothetical protein